MWYYGMFCPHHRVYTAYPTTRLILTPTTPQLQIDESMDVDVTGDDNHPPTGNAMRVPTAADAITEAEERHRRLSYPCRRRPTSPLNHIDASQRHSKFFGNNYWYLFLRLHYMLCERLSTIKRHAEMLVAQEAEYALLREKSTAVMLQIMTPS